MSDRAAGTMIIAVCVLMLAFFWVFAGIPRTDSDVVYCVLGHAIAAVGVGFGLRLWTLK